ncbi:MAG: ribonuclease domain-containing protein [Clostridia bacterium]
MMKKKSSWLLAIIVLILGVFFGKDALLPSKPAPPPRAATDAAADARAYDQSLKQEADRAGEDDRADATERAGEGHRATDSPKIEEDGWYDQKDDVVQYLRVYKRLPDNFITKKDAEKLGWDNHKVTLDMVAPGKSIGGSHFGNYEDQLPKAKGRSWRECDIDASNGRRGIKRIVYSSDGLIYYTGNHYKTFERVD